MIKNKKLLIFILIIVFIILSTILLITINNNVDNKDYYKKQYETLIQSQEDKLIIDKQEFINNTIKFSNAGRIAQLYLPEYFPYYGDNKIVFLPINNDYIVNNYHTYDSINNFTYNDNILEYNDSNTKSLFGIDISEYQTEIDWDKLKQDNKVQYVFIRVGYRGYGTGKIKLDEMFKEHIENANKYNIKVGVYFFSGAINTTEAIEEAQFVLDNIKDYNVELEVVFDMEEIDSDSSRMKNLNNNDKTLITKAFLDTIKSNGYTPMTYGNPRWFMEHVNYNELQDYNLWFANYSNFNWPYHVNYYQYSKSLNINGIKGLVDGNIKFIKQ